MAGHEIRSFGRALSPRDARIEVFDLLEGLLHPRDLEGVDLVLLGGSGDYSAAKGGPWLDAALDSLREVHASGVPAFASCWGFQAMAAAMGGRVVHDIGRAEVGTHEIVLTRAGRDDPVFASLPASFKAQMGHEDLVETLPPHATLLASSSRVVNQAYRFDDAPVYCTQFHPELDAHGILTRLSAYPKYVAEVAGTTFEDLIARIEATPDAHGLLRRFVDAVVKR
ncbi:MAG: type 1 glutamine amidotransferase [Gemmatimonadetes bacterium]|nr:type 1 glutamine amidotransferase [Gemmatimonadota bacterium]